MNVDRMRRNLSRAVPDRLVVMFDVLEVDDPEAYKWKLKDFQNAMRIKHRRDVPIQVYEDEWLATHLGQRAFVFRAYPQGR